MEVWKLFSSLVFHAFSILKLKRQRMIKCRRVITPRQVWEIQSIFIATLSMLRDKRETQSNRFFHQFHKQSNPPMTSLRTIFNSAAIISSPLLLGYLLKLASPITTSWYLFNLQCCAKRVIPVIYCCAEWAINYKPTDYYWWLAGEVIVKVPLKIAALILQVCRSRN